MRTSGYHRVSENSLAFAQKSKELQFNSFVAVHGGIGLGGVMLREVSRGLKGFAAKPLHTEVEMLSGPSRPQVNLIRAKLVLPQVLARFMGRSLDLILSTFGAVICILLAAKTNQALLIRFQTWQAGLDHMQWIAGILATIFGSYLVYWLCFISVVGRTPGQFFAIRFRQIRNDLRDGNPNPLIQKE